MSVRRSWQQEDCRLLAQIDVYSPSWFSAELVQPVLSVGSRQASLHSWRQQQGHKCQSHEQNSHRNVILLGAICSLDIC